MSAILGHGEPEGGSGIDRQAVLKQRRLMLGFTFLLAAYHGLNIKLGTSVSAMGLIATFDRPLLLVATIWFAWGWSILRYWQYERTYSNRYLLQDRHALLNAATHTAVVAAIQSAVDRGDYNSRGLFPGTSIDVIPAPDYRFATPDSTDEWSFPNLAVKFRGAGRENDMFLDGGANCSLDAAEVKAIREQVAKQLMARYPHFTDWTAPYYMLTLVPIAVIIDIFRVGTQLLG